MSPTNGNPDMLERRKLKRDYQKMATDEGLEEVILEMAVELKVNTATDKKHREASLADAHKWDKATVIKIAGIVTLVSMATASGASAALGG